MNKTTLSVIAIAMLGLAGCASTPANAPAEKSAAAAGETIEDKTEVVVYDEEQADRDRIVCSRQMATGSHRKTRYCRSVAQRDAERDAAQDMLRDVSTGGSKEIN